MIHVTMLTFHWLELSHVAPPSCKGVWEIGFGEYITVSEQGSKKPHDQVPLPRSIILSSLHHETGIVSPTKRRKWEHRKLELMAPAWVKKPDLLAVPRSWPFTLLAGCLRYFLL